MLIAVCLVCLGQTIAQTTVAKIGTTEYTTLQAAVDAAYEMTGDVTIEIVQDINGDYAVVREKNNLYITINGNNHALEGQIVVMGMDVQNGQSSLTVENLNISYDPASGYELKPGDAMLFVPDCRFNTGDPFWDPSKDGSWWREHGITITSSPSNHPSKITVRNCTFTMPSYSVNPKLTAIRTSNSFVSPYGITLENLTIKGGHSFAQFGAPQKYYGSDTAIIILNCTYTEDTHNGINISEGADNIIFVIKNNTVSTPDGYAIRIQNGGANKTAYFADNTFTAGEGIVLRNNTAAVATAYISSGNYKGPLDKATGTAENQNFVLTGGTYDRPVATVQGYCAPGYMAIDEDPEPDYCTVLKMNWLTFDANGGAGLDSVIYFIPTSAQTYTPVANNWFTHSSSYDFKCWNTKADGSGTDIYPGATMTITSDTVLYAKWKVVARIGSTDYPSLQAALDAAREMTGDVTVELLEDITEQVSFRQKEGLDLTIDGGGNTMTGQMFLHGDGRPSGTDKLTVTNFNFEYDPSLSYTDDTKGFICYWPTSGGHNYAHNVTMSNCTCTGNVPGDGMTAFRGPSGSQSYNTTIDHVVASNMHSLAQFQGAPAGLTITNCKAVTNVKNGINVVNGAGVITISKDTLTCSGTGDYSFRIDGTQEAYLSDNVFTSPVLLRGTASGKIYISSGVYDIIQEANYSAPTRYSITGGTFNHDVTDSCATGYGCYKDVDGYPDGWTVLRMNWVTYDANGGEGEMEPSYVAPFSNTSFTVKDNEFTWDVAFSNWNTKADGTGDAYEAGATMTISSDTTLYAQWNIVAKIGDNVYPSLQAAVDSANKNMTGDVTIELMQDTKEVVKILQKNGISITVNGNDNTLTGQIFISNRQGDPYPAYLGTYTESNTVTIDNLNMKYDPDYFDGTSDEDGLIYFCKNCAFGNVLNYAHNVTISNCDFDADGSSQNVYAISSRAGSVFNLNIENCTAKNAAGLARLQSAPEFEVLNCSTEDVKYGICIVNNNGPMTVTGNNFKADEAGILVTQMTTGATINFANDTVNAPKAFEIASSSTNGTLDITSGLYIGDIADNSSSDFFNISGGTYSEDVSGEPCAPGYAAFDNGDGTWTVTKAWFLYYDKNQTEASGTMDTLFVRQDGTATEHTLVVDACDFTWLPDHSFKAWNNKADGTGDTLRPGDNIILSSDTILYVIWQEGYTVFYHNNGGTGTIPNQSKSVGETITLSDGTGFSKTDSTLYWWNTEADESGTGYALGAEYSDDANLNLYASWRLNLNMKMDSADVVCYGEDNGTDTVKIIGGEMPFKLVLSGTESRTVDNIMTRTYVFENLKPGSYTVTLTDTLNKDVITGTFTIDQPDTLVVESVTVPVKPCPLMGTGTYPVSMTTTGGNGGNVITWGGDVTDADALSSTITPDADDRDRTYTVTVTVTDSKNCSATETTTFTVAPVISDDGSAHSNTTMTVAPISHSILYGCDTVIRDFGTPEFVFTNAAITDAIIDTVYNNVYTIAPDSIFAVGGDYTILWTAVDTCGHTVTAEQVISITHKSCPTVTDRDGNSYPAVRIGCDCWTTKNLASTHYSSDGTEIPDVMTYSATRTRSRAVPEYGYLYTYSAAMHGETVTGTTPVQGACPDGWHIPTAAESEALMASTEVRDLMSQGLWIPDNGTNASGFNLLPGGCYNAELDRYERMYVSAYFWIAVPDSYVYHACEFGAACSSTELVPGNLSNGFSIRCVLTKPAE